MKKSLFIILGVCLSHNVFAQNKWDGSVSLQAGFGAQNPVAADVRMNYQSAKFSFAPFFNIKGISKHQSSTDEDINLLYTKSGNTYYGQVDSESNGVNTSYGFNTSYWVAKGDFLQASFKVDRENIDTWANREECVHLTDGLHKSSIATNSYLGHLFQKTDASISYLHFFLPTNVLTFKYTFNRDRQDRISDDEVKYAHNYDRFYKDNLWQQWMTTDQHNLQLDWKNAINQANEIDFGVAYTNRYINTQDYMSQDYNEKMDEHFGHHMQVGAVFGEYNLKLKAFTATARLAYEYTRMQDQNLNDVVPMLRTQWNINPNNTLRLNYIMRIVRPGNSFLDPHHILGNYTEDYGVPTLKGTHINNYSLAHVLKKGQVTLTTTTSYIHVNDGLNAIWLDINDIRTTFWGNQGKRRAWSLNPDLKWNATPTTLVEAGAELLWDKRIADAIHMAKKHWGITTHAAIQQTFLKDLILRASCDYAEGQTVDLYSHKGRYIKYGGEVQKSFLAQHRLTAQLSYYQYQYPNLVITQGAYTGKIFTRNSNNYEAAIKLSYKW